ncbi:Uncharacterised protein [Raoultella terrigena]|uniref:Glycolate oxidase subunit GlcD n=1 Tax=Raoultella terrigena TaxID=577 RepID=A0A485CD06_RAOTE|nr:Uncharacterised protein [Raoultella terrigena]
MSLSREAIVDQLKEIVGSDRVITDETVLKRNSIDRFRKYADIHGVFTLPLPAAVVKLGSTEQVSSVLSFMNQHKINGSRVPALRRPKVASKPSWKIPWCWTAPG